MVRGCKIRRSFASLTMTMRIYETRAGASARGDSANHDLFQIARFRFRFRNLLRRERAAVEFAEVRARGGITGVGRNGVPDIRSKAVLRNAAAIFQRFGVEVLRLRKTLICGNLIELWGLGEISIRHQTAQVVGAESVVLVGGQLEPLLGRVG